MIKIKSKFIPPQPRNKKYLAVSGGGVVSVGYTSGVGSPVTNSIVVLPYSDVEYDVD